MQDAGGNHFDLLEGRHGIARYHPREGEAIRSALAAAKQVTLSSANGTNMTFGLMADKGFVSDGAITADKVKQGSAATQTWLPAGELLVPVALGPRKGRS